jgi:phosphohistidine phosphatase
MRLLILRHAIAVEAGTPGVADDDRPLTPRGRKRFAKAAEGLAHILSAPDALYTSPLPRALETAEIAAEAWGDITPTPDPRLAERHSSELVRDLASHGEEALVVVVGHEPHVSHLLAHLISGDAEALAFRKGGAALVEMDAAAPGRSRLVWFLPPRLLRKLGGY